MATHSSILAWRIPRNRGAWRATVHRVAKSRIWLKQLGRHPNPVWSHSLLTFMTFAKNFIPNGVTFWVNMHFGETPFNSRPRVSEVYGGGTHRIRDAVIQDQWFLTSRDIWLQIPSLPPEDPAASQSGMCSTQRVAGAGSHHLPGQEGQQKGILSPDLGNQLELGQRQGFLR